MKKNIFVLALFCFLSMMANAEVAKYCMSYEDFVADNWKSLDESRFVRSRAATTACFISRLATSRATRF